MSKRILLFAPAAFNLAETSRMVEIAKGVERNPEAAGVFEIQFISNGGEFERLIEKHGFSLTRMEPRLTKEKIENIARIDRGEKFAPAVSDSEMIETVDRELALFGKLNPVAVVTGSYLSVPISCRVLRVPLVWVIQSTWLPTFFRHGAGVTDGIKPASAKALADWFVWVFINFWIRYGFLNPVNRAARHYGVNGYNSIFEFWRGDLTLVAEPPEFSGITLPPGYSYTGPLIPEDEFPMPEKVRSIPRDQPIVYFAMGSSGTPEIVARILESFEGKPYRVIAPVKFQLARHPGVRIPSNVLVTDWLPALEANRMADLALIHGGIGTVLTAALAGKPVVGVGMQMEQVANLACLERLGFAIRIPKSRDPSRAVQDAIQKLLKDESARSKAAAFAGVIAHSNGPVLCAEKLLEHYGRIC